MRQDLPSRRFEGSLRAKMVLILAVSLLPLGLISVIQTYNAGQEAQAMSRSALLAATERAATEERSVMMRALGAASAVGVSMLDLLDTPEVCSQRLTEYVQRTPDRFFAAFVGLDGESLCSSDQRGFTFAEGNLFSTLISEPRESVRLEYGDRFSGQPALVASAPVFEDGALRGIMSIAAPRSSVSVAIREDDMSDRNFTLALFGRDGDIIGADSETTDASRMLPRDHALTEFVNRSRTTFAGVSLGGEGRHYAVVPILQKDIYAISSWKLRSVWYSGSEGYILPLLFPVLMLLVSMIVAYNSFSRLLIRPVNDLRRRMKEFEQGRRDFPESVLMRAPTEFQYLAEGFLSMTRTIAEDEIEREQAMQDKNTLLREVYHRVKNNLQLIVSIMNMQIRNAATPREKQLLQQLQERVMSLSVVHKNLYQASSLASVRADDLLSEVVAQLVGAGATRHGGPDVRTDFDAITLYPDQAVPVALLITEAGTNALKYTGVAGGGRISFRLKTMPGDMVELGVENSIGTPDEGLTSSGLGARLIDAFARQLGAEVERDASATHYSLRLVFPLSDGTTEADHGSA
ncbi:sensor histidine kinase [Oceanibium sediminis]|uniref:sensor histidine kinase n=1 Tax=Oceanibium sediminis TaxID=2026339 RepID=UPI00130019F1|nr:histidine kinase dimerization/phosphoacceptor domain -containing protein [Oceanibium sediminis]